jgi:hypothetical protein
MASMQINYPNTTAYLGMGIEAGSKLGGMIKNKSNNQNQSDTIPISLPGDKPQVNPAQVLSQESTDFDVISKIHKQTKGLQPEARKKVFDTAIQSGQIKTAIGQSVATNVDVVKPDEMINIMNSVKNSSPDSPVNIQMMIEKLGGETSPGGSAIKSKLDEVNQTQKQMDSQWGDKIKDTLLNLIPIHEDNRKFMGKNGRFNPSVIEAVSNENKYIEQLAPIDKVWVNDYLKLRKMQAIKQTGGSAKYNFRVDENGKLGVYVNGQLDLNQSDPNFTTTGTIPISQQDMIYSLMHQGQMPTKGEARGVPASIPKNPKGTLNREEQPQVISKDKYKVGQVYQDAQGNKAKWDGKKWISVP